MPSPISVKVKVPGWMKKFLEFQSEDNSAKILSFSRKHQYNLLLINLVSNYKSVSILQPIKDTDVNDSIVKIYLPFSKRKDVYFYNKINIESAKIFRREIQLEFLYEFKVFLRNAMLNGLQRKVAIETFLMDLTISEDELKFETLYRKYTRYMNKKKRLL